MSAQIAKAEKGVQDCDDDHMPDLTMTQRQVAEGVVRCATNSLRLLEDSLILVKSKGNISHALGLFTFAVEEYGKALLLWQTRGSGPCKVPDSLFKGKESHRIKFEAAIKGLPKGCTNLRIGIRVRTPFAGGRSFKVRGDKSEIAVGPWATGLFTIDTAIDLAVRMETFYVDWDDSRSAWRRWVTTSPPDLEGAITAFKAEIGKRIPSWRLASMNIHEKRLRTGRA